MTKQKQKRILGIIALVLLLFLGIGLILLSGAENNTTEVNSDVVETIESSDELEKMEDY